MALHTLTPERDSPAGPKLSLQQAHAMQRDKRLPRLVFGAFLLITLMMWGILRYQENAEVSRDFARRCATVTAAVRQKIATYELVLQGAAGMVAARQNLQPGAPAGSLDLDQAFWHTYVSRLDTEHALSALKAFGYAQAREAGSPLPDDAYDTRPGAVGVHAVINRFIEPLDSTNQAMLGYNQASNPERMAALNSARDSGTLALTATHLPGTVGFDAILPVYRFGAPLQTTAQRRAALLGFIFAWVDTHRLLDALDAHELHATPVAAYLGSTSYQTQVYLAPTNHADIHDSYMMHTDTIAVGSEALLLQYEGSDREGSHLLSYLALAVGLLLSALAHRVMRLSQTKRRIADQVRQDAQLRISQNEARMQGIVRSAFEAIITIDEDQNIVIFNPMAEKVFRCPAAQALGSPLHRFIPERFRQAHAGHVARFGITSVSERVMGGQRALFGMRADGQEFPIEGSISQIREGNRKLYTVMLRDITERVRAQEALESSRNELRLLSGNIQTVREEEKTRIARELHDDLGQQLTALKMDLSLLEAGLKKLPQPAAPADAPAAAAASAAAGASAATPDPVARVRTPPGPASLLGQTRSMHTLLDSTVASIRRIAADLRPVMLDDLGLAPAIEWLVNDFMTRYHVDVRLEMNFDHFEFGSASATAIFRIVQEALTNIARHAQASKAALSLRLEDDHCVIQIADNGRGTDLGGGKAGNSFGLLGIRERVHLLNGEVKMTSSPGNGFTLRVTLPKDVLQVTRITA